MSLSASEFKNRIDCIEPKWSDAYLDEMSQVVRLPDVGRYVLCLKNVSEGVLNKLAQDALNRGQFPENTKVYTKTKFSFWKVDGAQAVKRDAVSYRVHTLVGGSCPIKREDFRLTSPCVMLKSRSFPSQKDSGKDIVGYFRDIIEERALFRGMEWRFEGIESCTKEGLDQAIEQLKFQGFSVDLQFPYVVVRQEEGRTPIVARQSLSVRISQDAVIKKGDEIENPPFHQEGISSIPTLAVPDALRRIFEELAVIADKDSLVRRYAFNVAQMDSTQQAQLQSRLKELGYVVTLDRPFALHGFNTSYLKQFMYIDF